jgi:cyanate lyase
MVAKMLKLALGLPPVRGRQACDVGEPFGYRLTEVVQVYGAALKEVIGGGVRRRDHERDRFRLEFERVDDPKGNRVQLVLDGKFLPYRIW